MSLSEPQPVDGIEPSVTSIATSSNPWWTAERVALFRWLQRGAPNLAPLYTAAVRMVMDESFPGRVWLVAHAVREIRNRLPDAIAGLVAATRTDYGDLADAVHIRWVEDGLPADGTPPVRSGSEPSAAGPDRHEVSADLLSAVADLIAGHIAASENNRAKARRLFDAIGRAPAPSYVIRGWLYASRWINQFMHVRMEPLTTEDELALATNFSVFEQALMAISGRSYENMDALDEILDAANR